MYTCVHACICAGAYVPWVYAYVYTQVHAHKFTHGYVRLPRVHMKAFSVWIRMCTCMPYNVYRCVYYACVWIYGSLCHVCMCENVGMCIYFRCVHIEFGVSLYLSWSKGRSWYQHYLLWIAATGKPGPSSGQQSHREGEEAAHRHHQGERERKGQEERQSERGSGGRNRPPEDRAAELGVCKVPARVS